MNTWPLMLRTGIASACAMIALVLLPGCLARTAAQGSRGTRDVSSPPIEWPIGVTPDPFTLLGDEAYLRLASLPYAGPGALATVELIAPPPPGGFVPARIVAPGANAELSLTIEADDEAGSGEFTSTASLGIYLFSAAFETTVAVGNGVSCQESITQDPSVLWVRRPSGAPRGVALLLSGLSGLTPGGERLRDELLARGWLTVFSTPALTDPSLPLFAFDDANPTEPAAIELAHRIDAGLANRAYAMQAVHDQLMREQPALRTLPTVAIGCSAGAIALPTVVARMPDTIDAAVLIGGGADLVDILNRSSLLGERLNIMLNNAAPTAAEREELRRKTLERARLDPYHTAPRMDHVPALIVDARFDAIVPADTGDLLYERMGRPERWRYAVGHVGLFLWLGTQTDAVAGWIENAVDSRATASR